MTLFTNKQYWSRGLGRIVRFMQTHRLGEAPLRNESNLLAPLLARSRAWVWSVATRSQHSISVSSFANRPSDRAAGAQVTRSQRWARGRGYNGYALGIPLFFID